MYIMLDNATGFWYEINWVLCGLRVRARCSGFQVARSMWEAILGHDGKVCITRRR